jgi:hypothetical protein
VDGSSSDRYGIGVIDLIPYQNAADVNWINPSGDGYTYFSDLIFSGQPIPYETAAAVALVLDISTTSPLPTGTVGAAYFLAMVAVSGTTPYTWSIISGTLPAGLSFSSAGILNGTPTTVGTTSITIRVTDSVAATDSQIFSITIVAPGTLAITTTSLPNGTVGVLYGATLTATGGIPPYSWALASGTLPAGLSLSSSGIISGNPAVAGTASITVQVFDISTSDTQVLSITINPAGVSPLADKSFFHLRQ